MTIGKNLKTIKKLDKTDNILGQEKSIISEDILDTNKVIDQTKLINKKAVKSGLKAEDAEYLGDVIDMDLYKQLGQTFETLPEWRLGYERRVLNAGPKNLKGCKNAYFKYGGAGIREHLWFQGCFSGGNQGRETE